MLLLSCPAHVWQWSPIDVLNLDGSTNPALGGIGRSRFRSVRVLIPYRSRRSEGCHDGSEINRSFQLRRKTPFSSRIYTVWAGVMGVFSFLVWVASADPSQRADGAARPSKGRVCGPDNAREGWKPALRPKGGVQGCGLQRPLNVVSGASALPFPGARRIAAARSCAHRAAGSDNRARRQSRSPM